MTHTLEKQLGTLLDQYDEARRNTQMRKDQARADERGFLDDFAARRRTVLRPLFEAAGAMLVQHGHAFSIREQEFATHPGGAVTEASITFFVAPEGLEKPPAAEENLRALSFTTRHYSKAIVVRNGAAPHDNALAGAKGAYPLARIDVELAELELLKLMSAIVKA